MFELTGHDSKHPNGPGYFMLGAYTSDMCVPVWEINDRNASDIRGATTLQYSNVVLGISDPNIFFPPRNCIDLTNATNVSYTDLN